MAIKYGFFNSIDGDRKYTAADIGNYLMGIVSSGVYADKSTSLQVLANTGMAVEVQPGRAMLHYHYMESDMPLVLNLAAGGAQDRVDAIVALVDMNNRLCDIVVKKGTEAAKPTAPAMERTDTLKEYMLASVYVPRLSNSITQANITDTRADTTVCGFVTGVIDQVDTSTLFEQWRTAYDKAVAEMATWYAGLTDNYVDGTGLPIPSGGDAGKIPQVNEGGTGYHLVDGVEIDATLLQPGKAADAAATGMAIRKVPPMNLLDNSDFTNPVNQRGQTSYTGSKYGIDRWASRSGYCMVTVNNGSVNIKSTNGTTAAYVLQFIDPKKIKSGNKYTAACQLIDGSIHMVTAEVSVNMAEETRYIYVDGAQLGTIRLRYDTSEAMYAVMFSTLSTSGMDVVNVALYEGEYTAETLPEYWPKGYAAEMLACNVADAGNTAGLTLLWENASIGSGFAAQIVELDLTGFDSVIIETMNEQDSERCVVSSLRVPVGSMAFIIGFNGAYLQRRKAEVYNGGLNFGACQTYTTYGKTTYSEAGWLLKPSKIYGVKGVNA